MREEIVMTNQIGRTKASLIAPTKMTLMHLITGQNMKKSMVENTLDLCDLLYTSTDLKFTADDAGSSSPTDANALPTNTDTDNDAI